MPILGPSNRDDSEISVVETHNLSSDQLELIKHLRRNPVLAAKVVLGVELEWYQAEALTDVWHKRFSIFCWSRQIGKTFLEAVLFALLCCLYPDEDAVFIAPSLRQAVNPYNYVRQFYSNHGLFRTMVRGNKMTKMRVEFKNNSTMVPLPLGDGCLSNALLMSDHGLFYIENAVQYGAPKERIAANMNLFGENGQKRVDHFFYNGRTPIKVVRTKRDYELLGSLIHPIRVVRGSQIEWVRCGELREKDRVVLDRSETWFPNCNEITYDEAYAAGAMIGDGTYTNQYRIGFANAEKDRELIAYVNKGLRTVLGEEFTLSSDKVHLSIHGKQKRLQFFRFYGMPDYGHGDFRTYAKEKSFPPKILSCSKEAMRGFIQGLFDTDGHVCGRSENREVGFTNTSKKLCRELQTVLLKFGIVSSVYSRVRGEWSDVYELKITGQDMAVFAEKIGFRLQRKQLHLEQILCDSKRTYSLTDQIYHINDRMAGIICRYGEPETQSCDASGHTVASRVMDRIRAGKGISYDMLSRFLSAYRDYVAPSVGKVQNEPDFQYLEDVFTKHYYYDEIVSIEDGEADTYDAYIPEDHTFWSNGFISHNSKILGTHASIIGIDEYAQISKEYVDTVIMPMANRKKNPWSRGNRLSIISTPLSKTNHYYEQFCRYKEEQLKNPDGDYHVSTYTFLDSDNVDTKMIRDQIMSVPFERFARENLAQFTSNIGGFFSEELIRGCQDEVALEFSGTDEDEYVMGIDPPSVNNLCGICVLKLTENRKKAELVFCCGIKAGEITTPHLLGLAIRFFRRFNVRRMHIDQGGGGLQLAQMLFSRQAIVDDYENPSGVLLPPMIPEIEEWKGAKNVSDPFSMGSGQLEQVAIQITAFSPQYKSAMYFNLRNAMQSRDIILPSPKYDKAHVEVNALAGELEALKGGLTSSSLLTLTKPESLYDDRSDALALAYDACLCLLRGNTVASEVRGRSHDADYNNERIGDIGRNRELWLPDRSGWSDKRDW